MAQAQSKDTLCWYQRVCSVARSEDADAAYNQIVTVVLQVMANENIPHQFVYDNVSDTTNIVMPASIAANVIDLLTDAGFIEKDMPEKDVQASAELFEALRNGADLQKKWS